MMKKIILIGGGGHCKSVIDVIEQEKKFQIVGIIDRPHLIGTHIFGYEVIGCDDDLQGLSNEITHALITVGQIKSPDLRISLFNTAKKIGFVFPVVISPRAYVSSHANVSDGTVIMHDALINANAVVGENCIINSKALIEHDSSIGDHCHVSTGAIINGNVNVMKNCFVGSNAIIKESTSISENSFIKAGSVVV